MPAPPSGSTPKIQTRAADGVQIDHRAQIVHILRNIIVAMRGGGRQGLRIRHAAHVAQPVREDRVGAVLNPFGGRRIGGPAVRRVVLEAAVVRRIVRRRDDDAIGQSAPASAVVASEWRANAGVGV